MRGYDEFVGGLLEVVPPPVMLLLLIAVTALIAALWYWYPAWIPRRLPRLPRLPRWRFTRRVRRTRPRRQSRAVGTRPRHTPAAHPAPAVSLADRLAAEGRYAEAIRERLRDTVTALTRAGLIDPEPGTTAAELTGHATAGRPAVGPALTGATGLFSGIWYGRRPAGPGDDQRMRELTAEVRDALDPGDRR